MIKKKLISLTAALMAAVQAVTLTGFVGSAAVVSEDSKPAQSKEVIAETINHKSAKAPQMLEDTFDEADGEFDNKQAEKLYLQKLMYEDTAVQRVEYRNAARTKKTLTSVQTEIYNALLPELKKASAGNRTDAYFEIDTSKYYSDINDFVDDTRAAMASLRRDYPEYFYWSAGSWQLGYDGSSYYVRLKISAPYANTNDMQKFNTTKIKNAQKALTNAKNFAKTCASLPDYQKIYSFCDKICELNVYNNEAADYLDAYYSAGLNYPDYNCDPWEIISVFDNDPKTNVVCEGYSKAMQYLCDLSGIECYIVTSNDHMWNVVVLDGVSYHVDVTFADTAFSDNLSIVKKYHPYVLKGASLSDGKKVNIYTQVPGYAADSTTYVYEQATIDLIPIKVRKVSTSDYKPKSKISNLKGTSTNSSVKLTWGKNTSAAYYRVYIWKNNTWTQLTKTSNNTTLSYAATKLNANTSYKFRVSAYNKSNSVIASSDLTVKTKAKIANLKGTAATATIKLTWGKNTSAAYYRVYIWKNNKWTKLAQTKNNTTLSYTAAKLSTNTSYKFRVAAYNKSNSMIAYSDLSAKTKAKIANLKSTSSNSGIKLTWSKNTSSAYYRVYVLKGSKWTKLTQTKNNAVLTYTASKLKANTSYTFRVIAYNKSNNAIAYSNITSKTKAKMANLKSAPTKNSVKFTWGKNSSASCYKVFIWKNNKWTLLKKTNNNSVLNYTASKLAANKTYKFHVSAYNKSNKEIAYSNVTVKTKG